MARLLHTADWQLGMTRRWLADDDQARFTHDRIEGVRTLLRVAAERAVDVVVVAGDVFESNQVAPRTVRRTLEVLGETHVPVLLLPGNHDPLDAGSIYRSPLFVDRCPPNVEVLTDVPWHGVDGLEVVGAHWVDKHPGRDLVGELLGRLAAPPPGRRRVVVGHGTVDLLDPAEQRAAAIGLAGLEDALGDGRCDFVALGDRHSTTDVGSSGAVWYAGAHEVTDVDETDPGNVLVVDLPPGREPPVVTRVPVGRWRFHDERRSLHDAADVAALGRWLEELPEKDRTVVWLRLRGTLPLEALRRLEDGLDRAREAFAAVRLHEEDSRLLPAPDGDDLDRLGLSGYALSTLEDLRATAGEGGEAAVAARDALALLYRLAVPAEVDA